MSDRQMPDEFEEAAIEDAVIRLVGSRALRELDPADPAHAAFFEWLATDLRARQTEEERAEVDAHAVAWADRMVVRQLAERLKLVLVRGAAPAARLETPAPLGQCVEAGVASGRVASIDFRAAAGVGREIWEEPCTETIERPQGVGAGRYLALRIAGESMSPLMHDGDTVLVKLGPAVASDTVVVARRPDDGYVVKRVGRLSREAIELTSVNPDYPPIELPRDDGLILGTVVMRWCAHGDAA